MSFNTKYLPLKIYLKVRTISKQSLF